MSKKSDKKTEELQVARAKRLTDIETLEKNGWKIDSANVKDGKVTFKMSKYQFKEIEVDLSTSQQMERPY